MASETDIAWLAGIVDGEGCFSVKRPIVRKSGERKGSRTTYQVWLVICNTSERMIRRIESILASEGVEFPKTRKVWKGKKATRWQWWLLVQKKHELLKTTERLLPYLVAKKDEAEVVAWFLRRACVVKYYKSTPLDRLALDTLATIKRHGGEAPVEILDVLREVIPSQAIAGRAQAEHEAMEGVETRVVSPNDNRPHECPTPVLN